MLMGETVSGAGRTATPRSCATLSSPLDETTDMARETPPHRPAAPGTELDLDFPSVDYATWRRRVEEELDDAPFESLTNRGPEGLEIEPLYTAEHLPRGFDGAPADLLPPRQGRGWRIAEEIASPSIAAAEEAIGAGRQPGAELLWLRLDLGAAEDGEIDRLAAAVDPAANAVVLDTGAGALDAASRWIAAAKRRGVAAGELRGGFACDPLGALASRGAADAPEDALEGIGTLAVRTAAETPGMRSVLVSTLPYRDAGATAVDELAFALATGVAYLRRLTAAGLGIDDADRQLLFAVGVGCDLFLEIGKLRALRQLWASVVAASGGARAGAIHLHARTSAPGPATRGPWGHLLHATAGTFAAIVGGADSIATVPYDETLGEAGGASRRLAVNVQRIAAEEAHLGRVADPAAGSWTVESLTDRLARAAWDRFRELEAAGGMARCLAEGTVREILGGTA